MSACATVTGRRNGNVLFAESARADAACMELS